MRPTAVEVGLWILTFGAPLALGGAHIPTVVVFGILALLLLLAQLLRLRATGSRLQIPWFGWLLFALAAWTTIQSLPLPMALLRGIAPRTAEIIATSFGAYAIPTWHPISLSPELTRIEALRVFIYVVAFIVAHNHLHRPERRHRLLYGFVLVSFALTALGLFGAAVSPGKPLLFYAPQTIPRTLGLITTSFVNPNHGGIFLAMGTIAAVAVGLEQRSLQQRAVLLVMSAFCGLGVMLTLSRGAITALAFGLFTLIVVVLRQREQVRSWRRTLEALVAIAILLALTAWLAYEPLVKELQTLVPTLDSAGKFALWPAGLTMLLENPWVGVGRGAFASTFPHYLDMPAATTFSHLENQYLHLPIELGAPVGIAVILLSFIVWAKWYRGTRSAETRLALVVILPMVALHNVVDFNLELLGIALPVAIIAGALSACSPKPSRHRRPRKVRKILLLSTTASALVLLPLFAPSAVLEPPAYIAHTQQLRALGKPKDGKGVKRRLLPLIKGNPADCFPHLMGAQLLHQLRDRESVRWVNRALFLCPRSYLAHLRAAEILFATNRRAQGQLECQHALLNGPGGRYGKRILVWCLSHCKSADDVQRALPAQSHHFPRTISVLLGEKRYKLALAIARSAHGRWPRDLGISKAYVEALLATGNFAEAANNASDFNKRFVSAPLRLLQARATEASGDKDGALAIFSSTASRYARDKQVQLAHGQALLRMGKHDQALKQAQLVLSQAVSRHDQIQAHLLLEAVFRATGRLHRARYEAKQVRDLRARR